MNREILFRGKADDEWVFNPAAVQNGEVVGNVFIAERKRK